MEYAEPNPQDTLAANILPDEVPLEAVDALPSDGLAADPENPLVTGRLLIELTVPAEATTNFVREIQELVARYAVATEVESSVNWQYEQVRDRIPGSEPSLEEIALDRRLSINVKDAMRDAGATPFQVSLHSGVLESANIRTLRDVIVAGRGLAYARRKGPRTVAILEGILATTLPEIEWKDHPALEDIAAVCPSLAEVPAFAARVDLYHSGSILDVLSRPTVPDHLAPADDHRRSRTWSGLGGIILESDHARVREFAAKFQIAQAQVRLRRATEQQR